MSLRQGIKNFVQISRACGLSASPQSGGTEGRRPRHAFGSPTLATLCEGPGPKSVTMHCEVFAKAGAQGAHTHRFRGLWQNGVHRMLTRSIQDAADAVFASAAFSTGPESSPTIRSGLVGRHEGWGAQACFAANAGRGRGCQSLANDSVCSSPAHEELCAS